MTARELQVVIQDFADGANRLSAMSSDWMQGQFKPIDLTQADGMLRGLQFLMVEIRQLAALEA